MDAELKRKWVEALRSGKYKQGQRRLRTEDDRWCCLGTLCDLLPDGKWVRTSLTMGKSVLEWAYQVGEGSGTKHYAEIMPCEIAEALGIGHKCGLLVSMNDHEGKSFEEIADYIEQNL